MKITLKVFNYIILALSLVAGICLFAMPTVTFNSNIALDVQKFSEFLPQNEYMADMDMVHMLGTDAIEVSISFNLSLADTTKVMKGDREIINNNLISKNVDDIANTLHEPVNLITDYSFRYVIKKLTEQEVTKQIQKAIDSQPEGTISSTAEDIKMEAGMDDAYFTNLSYVLYAAANEDGATADTVSEVLFDQIDEALSRADFKTQLDKSMFDQESNKEAVKSNLVSFLNDYELVNGDGTLKKINQLSYVYLADYLAQQLQGKVTDPTELEQRTDESSLQYADRLLSLFVLNQTPDMVYQIIGYVAIGLLIGIFVFAAIWLALFIITLVRSFSRNKPWTIFGPWFWILGSLQIVLGIGLLVLGKFVLPNANISMTGLPLKSLILAPRTYALIPSLIFIAMIAIGIAYAVIKGSVKRQMRDGYNGGGYNNQGGYYDPNNGYNNQYGYDPNYNNNYPQNNNGQGGNY